MSRLKILGEQNSSTEQILTEKAQELIILLHDKLNDKRLELVEQRQVRQEEINKGNLPTRLEETKEIRNSDWQVAPTPDDLNDRRCEITGPVERKMMINALNSGAKVFMGDFEDATSPNWKNVIDGQVNCRDAIAKTISFHDEKKGKSYKLREDGQVATLLARPRGWHLSEKNVTIDDQPISGSLFDFGLYFFHNIKTAQANGSATYFYLPKLESHLEARLWNDAFNIAQDFMGVKRGTIRATVLIETILAAFEMEEILYELREHISGLNAGRWDYIFSCIKRFRNTDAVFPDRAQITMTVPFMRAYTERMVRTCHKRGAHAIGGMSAFIPNRRDPEVTEKALEAVRNDKKREANDGFDGSWVAHPDLVPICVEEFTNKFGKNVNQKTVMREEVDEKIKDEDLINFNVPNSNITETGFRTNVMVAMEYLDSWFRGNGAAALHNLMEDAATAEISRAQVWQWIKKNAKLDNGTLIDEEFYKKVVNEEFEKLKENPIYTKLEDALDIFNEMVLNDNFDEFLTLKAYQKI